MGEGGGEGRGFPFEEYKLRRCVKEWTICRLGVWHNVAMAVLEMDLVAEAEHGLPLDSIEELRQRGLTFTEVGETVIAPRTLKHRKARGESLSTEETERVMRVVRLWALAKHVFGNEEKALKWLRKPSERLAGRSPLSLLRTESGGRVVEQGLWQIDEGVFA